MAPNLQPLLSWSAWRDRLAAVQRRPVAAQRHLGWVALIAVLVLAVVPRLVLLIQLASDAPTFHHPEGGDSRFYDAVASGQSAPQRAYFHSPLYRWFLSGLYGLFGRDLLLVRVVQLALGVATVALVYWLALRLYRRLSVAVLAGTAAALLAPALFYEAQLLVDGLMALLALVVLHLLLSALRRPTARAYLLVGVALGVAALGRAVMLVWLPLLLWFVARSPGERRDRWRFVAALVGGVALAVLPVTLRNVLVEGDLVLITANAGLNLYVGNNPEANGGYSLPEGLWFRPGDPLDDFAGFAAGAQALGHEPSSSELSRWWASKAWAFVTSHPLEALALTKEKLRILINDYEYPQLVNFHAYGEVAPVLAVLPRAGLVVPAGLVGLAAMWLGRHGRRRRLLALLVISYALAFVPFFITGRYRVAWLVLLTPFAAWAVVRLGTAARRGRLWRAAGLALATALLVVAALWPLRAYPSRAHQHLDFARTLLHQGQASRAADFAQRATQLEPRYTAAWALHGRALRESGKAEDAVALLEPRLTLHDDGAVLRRELGAALLAADRPAEAVRVLEETINRQPGDTEAWLWLGDGMVALGCPARARATYRAVIRFAPGTARAQRAQIRIRELMLARAGKAADPPHCPR